MIRRFDNMPRKTRASQCGFSIVSAIFLLVVLASLGAAMLTISSTQHTSSALDVEGARAYQAARAGMEWGAHRIMRAPASACFAGPATFVPPASTLSSYTVTVTCVLTNTAGVTVFEIVSTACNRPNAGACPGVAGATYYVERQLRLTL